MSVIAAFYALVFVVISTAMRYEDNPLYVEHHRASYLTDVDELIFVTKQTKRFYGAPRTLCQAMMKLRYIGDNKFEYIVYYAPPFARTHVKAFVTTLQTGVTARDAGQRFHHNVISYQTSQHGSPDSYKVMYANPQTGCFILAYSGLHGSRGCRLLQTSSTVNRGIPPECDQIYTQNCQVDHLKIYYPICGMRLPHIVHRG
uniref:Putative secreted protein n=1 Tax=Amblyomma triste TaxID=251400 RepID=A0A023GD99_AMBTT